MAKNQGDAKHCNQCGNSPICRTYSSLIDFSSFSSASFGEYRKDIIDEIINKVASNCKFFTK